MRREYSGVSPDFLMIVLSLTVAQNLLEKDNEQLRREVEHLHQSFKWWIGLSMAILVQLVTLVTTLLLGGTT